MKFNCRVICLLLAAFLRVSNCASVSAIAQVSHVDPLEFDRTLEPKTLSLEEFKKIKSLWYATCKNSAKIKQMTDGLLKDGVSMSQVQSLLDDVLRKEGSRLAPTQGLNPRLMSLTISSLEPNYPVPGGHGPAYLLPIQAKFQRGKGTGASSGSSIAFTARMNASHQISSIFRRMVLVQRAYERRLIALRDIENLEQKDAIQEEHEAELKKESQDLRCELVELSGEDTVHAIDAVYKLRRP